jgi:hypothetical protein
MVKKKKDQTKVIDQEVEEAQSEQQGTPPWEDPPASIAVEIDQIEAPDDNVEILGKNQEYSLTMYLDPDVEAKFFVRFIKKVEQLVRSNPDYKDYITLLRDEMGLDTCAYLGKVDVNKAEIQLHHCISNLYTICVTVCNRLMKTGKQVTSFILADEVVRLHMNDKIALVPLTTTMHELVHAGKIQIPKNVIFGNYHEYFEEHKEYMDEYELKLYEDIEGFEVLDSKEILMLTTPVKETETKEEEL